MSTDPTSPAPQLKPPSRRSKTPATPPLQPPARRDASPLRDAPPIVVPAASAKPASRWAAVFTTLLFGMLAVAAIAVFVVLPDWVENRPAQPAQQAAAEPSDVPGDGLAPAAEPIELEPERASPGEAPASTPEPTHASTPEPAPEPAVAKPPAAPRKIAPPAGGPRPTAPQPAASTGSQARQPEPEFAAAMSEGLAALDRKDFAAAREAFTRANSLQPAAAQSADGLARAEQGLRLERVTGLRQEAVALEAEEGWHAAAERYRAVLAIDPTVQFAQDGELRTRRRAELADRFQGHLDRPSRLASDAVLAEARELLEEAADIDDKGSKLQQQIDGLRAHVEAYATPVQATLQSDSLTEIVIYKVGRLGAFDQRTLYLRPGSYTVVGSRRGYRDVRRRLEIVPGVAPQPLSIRCEEKI
ncbi:MAG: hypothetical protein AAF560_03645 [Acidobacteriota bacterium]